MPPFFRLFAFCLSADNLPFPASYPTSCLLGSVDVADVMSQEDYRETYPQGESSSPYVFICQNPQELLIKYPMSGQHKICKFKTIKRVRLLFSKNLP